ncbi:hypothetical protein BDZ85DRAFT_266384 [Elsinoe ampelina]|uniref:Uncharacterized protein n=1 Tax=Elsinoe ampelina TaxID=302913 RepID=A0A6A6G5Y2_9PEZI|nr:hypothetical protein BDZ85DRAFT_266384 [Elsinoe ampelina]
MDPHQGGDLSDMAATGTKIPNDAGQQRIIPSVPRPDQIATSNEGGSSLAQAATNQADMPRANKDIGATGEVMTGTGDQLPAQIESKRLHFGANDPLSKGHDRYDKHSRQKESDLERYAKDGAEVEGIPGVEDYGGNVGRESRGL